MKIPRAIREVIRGTFRNIDGPGEGQACFHSTADECLCDDDDEECDWLLKYESWYEECFEYRGAPRRSSERVEAARKMTPDLVANWQAGVDGYGLVASDFDDGFGGYGVSWALFRLKKRR